MNLLKRLKEEMPSKISKELVNYTGDLNNIKTTGFTYARGTATNIPATGHFFFLTTIAMNETNVYQRATRLINDTNLMLTYERQCVSGKWTEWITTEGVKTLNINTDFNTITATGKYYFISNPTGENKPVSKSGLLEVFAAGNFVTQRYTTYDGQTVYTRGYSNGTWYTWK